MPKRAGVRVDTLRIFPQTTEGLRVFRKLTVSCVLPQEGHILAVEYLEETPLMLSRPGMGLKLNTFYRRKHERDAGHLDIRKGTAPVSSRPSARRPPSLPLAVR